MAAVGVAVETRALEWELFLFHKSQIALATSFRLEILGRFPGSWAHHNHLGIYIVQKVLGQVTERTRHLTAYKFQSSQIMYTSMSHTLST